MRLIRIGIATLLATFPLGVFSPSAHAIPARIGQNIFPLECIFETVNDGSNTVVYITPDECLVIFPPDPEPEPEPNPNPTNPVTPNIPDGATVLPPTIIQTGNGIVQSPGLIIPRGPTGAEAAQQLPFEPVAVLQSAQEAEATSQIASTSTAIAAVVVGLTALGLVILIALA